MYENSTFSCSIFWPTLHIVSLFHFSHSDECVLVFHYSFIFICISMITNHMKFLSHILIYIHTDILFCKMPAQVFCSFCLSCLSFSYHLLAFLRSCGYALLVGYICNIYDRYTYTYKDIFTYISQISLFRICLVSLS